MRCAPGGNDHAAATTRAATLPSATTSRGPAAISVSRMMAMLSGYAPSGEKSSARVGSPPPRSGRWLSEAAMKVWFRFRPALPRRTSRLAPAISPPKGMRVPWAPSAPLPRPPGIPRSGTDPEDRYPLPRAVAPAPSDGSVEEPTARITTRLIQPFVVQTRGMIAVQTLEDLPEARLSSTGRHGPGGEGLVQASLRRATSRISPTA